MSAFVSVMKGCDKFCTFCIVPFTRGREVSRPAAEIVDEVRRLADNGTKRGGAARTDRQQLWAHQARRPYPVS